MRKYLLNILLLCLLTFTVSGCGIAASLVVKHGLQREPRKTDILTARDEMESRVPGIKAWIDTMSACGAMRDTFIVRDGVRLHACFAAAGEPSAKTAVIMHGYNANPINMMPIARMFRDSLGYNVWLPSERKHGLSEGEAVQMGWLDRLDLLEWSRVAHEYFKDTLQVYHGISMGAAAVMNASGEQTPDYVKGFVEDCGFSTLWDVVYKLASQDYHLPAEPILESTDKIVRDRFGWSIRDDSCVEQLSKCTKPMLFIHGDADQIVPVEMVQKNYDAKVNGYREMWIVPGARHAFSYPVRPAEYTARVRRFLKEQVEN